MNLANTIKAMYEKRNDPPFDTKEKDYAGAAKELHDYAMKNGGIDKGDFLKVANQLKALAKQKSPSVGARMMRDVQALDTDVREKVYSVLKKHGLKEELSSDLEVIEEAMVRGKEVFDKTFANRKQAVAFADKNGGYVKQVGRVFYVFKGEPVKEAEDKSDEDENEPCPECGEYPCECDDVKTTESSCGSKKMKEESKLDELSPATHKRYQDAAFKDAAKGMAQKRMGTRSAKSAYDKEQKRYKGIDTSKYLNRKQHGVKEEVELEEAYKTPAEASAYEAGKKAVAKGVSYDDNPNKKGSKEYTAWSKGHNDARARKIARKEEVEIDVDAIFEETIAEAKSKEQQIADLEKMLDRISGNTSSVKMKKVALQRKIDKLKNEELEENNSAPRTAAHRRAQMTRNPNKSGGTGYDLYHKDFSSAMQHAYKYAKDKLGIEIDPKEIDDKVASGPRKPSKGKTNSYRLMGKDGKKGVQIQVANLDDKRFELNMYKESVELDEAQKLFMFKTKAEADKKAKEVKGKVVPLTKQNFAVVVEDVELDELKAYDKNADYRLLNRLSQKAKTGNLTPAEKSQMANAKSRLRNHGFSEEVELDEAFMKWQVKVGAKVWRGTARNAGEAVKKARPSMGNLDLSKASVTRIDEEKVEDITMTLEEAVMQAVFGEAKKVKKEDNTNDKSDDGEGMDKVQPKELKKKFDGRKDKDIDNDGDTDDSDEYLHKRRQTVAKAIEKDKKKPSGKQEPVDTAPSLDEEGEPMSDAEKAKMEKIKAKLDAKKDEFVKKYGDRAKEVIARTAIKMAKKESYK